MMETDEYFALVAAIADKQARLSTSSFFFTGEDAIRVSSFNSVAGVELSIEGRMIDPRGRTVPFAFRHVPNSDRTIATSVHLPGEGFLLGVQVRAAVGAPRVGQCFVLVELGRGTTGGFIPLHALVQGYATDTSRLVWPGSGVHASKAGAGAILSVAGADPAAGAEALLTVPTNARQRLDSFRVELVTDATVANRTVTLIIDDGATTLASVTASAAQTAGQTRQYQAYASGGAPRLDGTVFYLPIPPDLVLMGGFRVRTSTAGIVAGDNFGAPQALVEEWIED